MTSDTRRCAMAALLVTPFALFIAFLFFAPSLFQIKTAMPCTGPNVLREWWCGGLQMWSFPAVYRILCAAAPLLILLLPEEFFAQAARSIHALYIQISAKLRHPFALFAAAGLLLWLLRTSSISFGDSQYYVTELIPKQALSRRGMFMDYNSVGSSLLYSLGYRYANLILAVTVLLWYQVVGILSLLLFFGFVYTYRRGATLVTGAAMLLLFAGNWSQTTFGAPENYGQVSLCVVAYAILAVEVLAGREPLWKACLAFAIGAFFHLIIGWLLPTLLLLMAWRWRAEDVNGRLLAIVAIVLPAALTGSICYYLGFDLSFLTGGNAGEGKLIPFLSPMDPYSGGSNYQYATFDPRHLAHILQENLLMGWPGILALLVALPFLPLKSFLRDRAAQFLILLLACALLFNLLWNPDLEMWKDQDLFSLPGIAWCLLGAYVFASPALADLSPATRRRLLAAAIIGGLAWRIPVALYHSVLSANYGHPELLAAPCPFAN